MGNRTQIVCLCEGAKGSSIDAVFINRLIRSLNPAWIRSRGSNVVRLLPCGSRGEVIRRMPEELKQCLDAGGNTTLMVWADCDDDCADGDALRKIFWQEARAHAITERQFDQAVFIFAKDRLENWIQFLNAGGTDEMTEAPRLKNNREVTNAANRLAELCGAGKPVDGMPPSLQWSCRNWRSLASRIR